MPRLYVKRFGPAVAADGGTLNTPTQPAGPANFSGLNTDNFVTVASGAIAAPSEGLMLVLAVWVYMAGHTGAVNTRGGIWIGNGTLIASSTTISVPKGNGNGGGQFWTRFPFDNPAVLLGGGGVLYFPGWWRQSNQDHEWSVFGSGNFSFETLAAYGNIGNVTTCTGSGFTCGDPGIAVEYAVMRPRPGDGDE